MKDRICQEDGILPPKYYKGGNISSRWGLIWWIGLSVALSTSTPVTISCFQIKRNTSPEGHLGLTMICLLPRLPRNTAPNPATVERVSFWLLLLDSNSCNFSWRPPYNRGWNAVKTNIYSLRKSYNPENVFILLSLVMRVLRHKSTCLLMECHDRQYVLIFKWRVLISLNCSLKLNSWIRSITIFYLHPLWGHSVVI